MNIETLLTAYWTIYLWKSKIIYITNSMRRCREISSAMSLLAPMNSGKSKDTEFIFVDFVRGLKKNDSIDFLANKCRANVLITRQKLAWFLIAGLNCVLSTIDKIKI